MKREDLRKLAERVVGGTFQSSSIEETYALAADYLRYLDALERISRRPHDGPGTAFCPRCIARETLGLPADDKFLPGDAALSPQEPSDG